MVYDTARHPEALRSVPGARAVCGSMPSGLGRRHPHGSLTAYRNHARWAHETDSWRRCTLRVPAMPGVAYRRTSARPAWPRSRLVHAAGSADRHATTGGRVWCARTNDMQFAVRVCRCGVALRLGDSARLVSLHSAGGQAGGCARPACARCVGGALRLAKPLVCAPRRVGPARSMAPVFRGFGFRDSATA